MQEFWPDPDRFDPDRFLTPPKPFTFVPFNGGPRLCLGMDMSYMEAKAALVHLLRRCAGLFMARGVHWAGRACCFGGILARRRAAQRACIVPPRTQLRLGDPMILRLHYTHPPTCRYRFRIHPGFQLVLKSKVMLTAKNGVLMDLEPRE
jgi:hypothetical protein